MSLTLLQHMNEFIKTLIWRWFGKKILESYGQIERSETDCAKYADISAENVTALLANSVSNIAMGDSQVFVSAKGGGTSRFSDILVETAAKEWADISDTVACALGCGAIISVPYSVDNGLGRKIYIDTVTKDRFFVTGMQGDDITQCVILADEFVRDNKRYKRFTDYSINNGVYIIRNRAVCNDSPVSLTAVEEWADIPEQIAIGGVKQLPIAVLKCPQNPRKPNVPQKVTGISCETQLDLTPNQSHVLDYTVLPSNAEYPAVEFHSTDPEIAAVDKNSGNITAKAEGVCQITVTTLDGGFTAACTLNVLNTEVFPYLPEIRYLTVRDVAKLSFACAFLREKLIEKGVAAPELITVVCEGRNHPVKGIRTVLETIESNCQALKNASDAVFPGSSLPEAQSFAKQNTNANWCIAVNEWIKFLNELNKSIEKEA